MRLLAHGWAWLGVVRFSALITATTLALYYLGRGLYAIQTERNRVY
jgi:hypothetical protein